MGPSRGTAAILLVSAIGCHGERAAPYPHRTEPIGSVRAMYDGALPDNLAVNTFRNIDRLFPTRLIAHSAHPHPLPPATQPLREIGRAHV